MLIAEDDDVNAVIATAYLEHMGVTAERVKDGQQAVRHALRDIDRPDLVLMDCRMPTMDGMAATREIRAQERSLGLARVPVIALTATTSDINRQLCLNAGMDDFMSKPYTKEELGQVLGRWLRQREAVAQSDLRPRARAGRGSSGRQLAVGRRQRARYQRMRKCRAADPHVASAP